MENVEEKNQKNAPTECEASVAQSENIQKNAPADFEAAIKQTGYGKYNFILALLAFPGMFSSVLCSTTISFVLPAAQCDLELTNFDKGVLNAISYAGLISGGLVWGVLSDKLGRRKILIAAYLLDGLFSFISSLAQTLWFLQLFRFAVGFASSGPYGILITYLLEFHSNQYRSRLLMITTIFVSLSFIFIPGFAWLILPQLWSWELSDTFKYHSWNVFIAVCSLPSFIAGFMIFFCKETPKFLMSKGQCEEAMEVFKYIYSFNTGKTPDTYPVKELVNEMTTSSGSPSVEASEKSILTTLKSSLEQVKPLFRKSLLPMVILVNGMKMASHFGINTLRLWMPQIFSLMQEFLNDPSLDSSLSSSICDIISRNKTATELNVLNENNVTAAAECTVYVSDPWIYVSSMIVGAVCLLCSFSGGALINCLGKRILMVFSFLLAGLSGLSIYWTRSTAVTTALFSLYQALNEIGITCVVGMAIELFPTTVRSLAVSLAMVAGRVGSLTGNLLFPILLDASCEVPFFLTSSLVLCCGFLAFLFPSMKKNALK